MAEEAPVEGGRGDGGSEGGWLEREGRETYFLLVLSLSFSLFL